MTEGRAFGDHITVT